MAKRVIEGGVEVESFADVFALADNYMDAAQAVENAQEAAREAKRAILLGPRRHAEAQKRANGGDLLRIVTADALTAERVGVSANVVLPDGLQVRDHVTRENPFYSNLKRYSWKYGSTGWNYGEEFSRLTWFEFRGSFDPDLVDTDNWLLSVPASYLTSGDRVEISEIKDGAVMMTWVGGQAVKPEVEVQP